MTPLAAYLLLFVAVGVGFIFVHLVAGKLIRPSKPGAEKGTIYECGEPTIGSAWVQFDLRFYVVALLFVIFDVEVAFCFPWAEVFGKANAVANTEQPTTAADYRAYAGRVLDLAAPASSSPQAQAPLVRRFQEMRTLTQDDLDERKARQARAVEKLRARAKLTAAEGRELEFDGPLRKREFEDNRDAARQLSVLALGEVVVFFGVLLVGFAYLWRRGDLAWVRSTTPAQTEADRAGPAVVVVGTLVAAGAETPAPAGAMHP
jgi:NADH-quinone oxidoreductase subunit A